jgi:transposase InsO family protein
MLAQPAEANMRELCRRHGISPTTGYKWLARFKEGGAEGLQDESRRPRLSPAQTKPEVEKLVVALRGEHPAWGGRKLRRRLKDLGHADLPAASTITDILRRHDLLSGPASAAPGPWQRFERPAPNQLWQLDFKGHFAMANGRCHPLTMLDDHSRFNVALQACEDETEDTARAALGAAFARYGMPDGILCDNGSPWGAGGAGHTALSVWLLRLGISVYHGRAYHPQTQGKEERFHRTLKAEVIQRGGWTDCPQVQRSFDDWRPVYNCQRPHEALGLETPAHRYRQSQRPYPQTLPTIQYDLGVEVRKVDGAGRFSYRNRLWKAGTGFHGQAIGVRPTQTDGLMEILFATKVIQEIDLRPSAPNQQQ